MTVEKTLLSIPVANCLNFTSSNQGVPVIADENAFIPIWYSLRQLPAKLRLTGPTKPVYHSGYCDIIASSNFPLGAELR